MMKVKTDLSVIVTVHNEGLVAHKTMLSIFDAVKKIEEVGYRYEIIIHIDNGDDATIDYFERYKDEKNIKIYKNSFGDTGPSRNFAVSKAEGEYVAFLDGDDLVSANWYLEAIKTLNATEQESVVHPEAVLTFGIEQKNVLTIQKESYSMKKDTLIMLGENRWCSVLVARKETLLKFPYKKLEKGYGHEDYVFNLEVTEAGILHKIAKKTVLFYRRSNDSRLSNGVQEHVIIPYVKLFDFQRVKGIEVGIKAESKKRTLRDKGYKVYKKIRNNAFLNYFITPFAKLTIKVVNSRSLVSAKKAIPAFVIEEWKNINRIETQLYPCKNDVKKVSLYSAEDQVVVGNAFREIAQSVSKKPDYVFIVPWVVMGGADKVLLNYLEALKETHNDCHFAIIATVPVKNSWVKKLPKCADFIDFGNISAGLTLDAQDTLFSRVITQLDCENIHIINSEYGYEWARKHLDLVENSYKINVSLFCGEFIPGSDMRGVFSYDDPYLLNIYGAVKNVFTDNNTIIKKTMEHNGFDEGKFKVHYQPVKDIKITSPKVGLINDGKLKILWAGRVVPTKLPQLVAEIGKKLNPNLFHIDVFGEKAGGVDKDIFDGIPALDYKGAFNGFSSIPTDKYDVLLYTSLDDGLPNILLEATAAGLPIIASNDGGVGEFIQDGKTGVLVEDFLNPDAYIKAINDILNSPEKTKTYVDNAQRLLIERHSWKKFVETVARDLA